MNSRRPLGSLRFLVTSSSGITLVEVLTAIFVMGVGLLALLTLFPLGALSMAQAVKDDRAGAIAEQAMVFSKAGEDLVLRTQDFVQESLLKGAVDLDVAARLDEEYEQLALDATFIERQLEDLQSSLPPQYVQPHTAPLLAQIEVIQRRIRVVRRLFALVDRSNLHP